ncbi:MptD family putative ECF transporter S component [Eggerthella sinensis]|uniref:MptD family putative ECF transporter S component n=1 Tax=Eggerthella sinensis TaxID=242230 RepID=UPI00248E1AC4|nr:MptD family putative ECF transporter S component [Eggerthella sinensis]
MGEATTGAKRTIARKEGLGVRDLVTVAVFTVVYFVFFFISGSLGMIPIFVFFFPLPLAFLTGISNTLFYTKAHTFGMIAIMGTLLGLISFLMGYGPLGLGFGIGCGVAADLIMRAGKYQSFKAMTAGHCVFSLWILGTMLPMWIMGQAYFEPYRATQGDAYVNESLALLSGGMLAAVVAGIVVCAVLGMLLGRVVLKKHFERAGIA